VATASGILVACGGFLLAVLWMDLMFDVQVLRHRDAALADEVLASIAGYYRRVTTTARPMTYLVGTVMAIALTALVVQMTRGPGWVGLVSLPLLGGPILLAMVRVYPNAVRLGTRADTPLQQAALARSICRDHFLCLGGVLVFLALQLAAGSH
jgi:hypothetical protein